MNVAVLEPVVGRLRRRRSLLHADAERIAPQGSKPGPVGELIDSVEDELASLLSLGGDGEGPEAVGRALWLQHQRLRQHAETIDSLLDVMLHFETSASWQRAAVRVLLTDFARELRDHLAFEEEEGCLERAAEAEPRFAKHVVALRDEHEGLRMQVTQLAATAQLAEREVDAWEPVRRDFEDLCYTLRLHEQAEAEVLHETYLVDLGGSG
jgi:hypothetical protein